MSTPASSSGRSGDDGDERRMDRHRAEVGVEAEAAAQREERLLRADRRLRVVPASVRRPRRGGSRPPRRRRVDVLGPDRDAVGVDRRPADEVLRPFHAEAERRAGRLDDPARRVDDLRPDPVTGDDGDRGTVLKARPSSASAARRTPTATPLISAPWSLFTATRYASSDASMMLVDSPWPETTSAPGPLVRRAAAADQHLALGVLAGGDGLDLVLGEDRVPAEDRLERLVDRPEERVDRAVPGRLGTARRSPATVSDTVPVALPPCDEVTLQPSRTTTAGTSVAALLRRARAGPRR